ncbi:Sac2 family-domain-containing protein [Cladochytrium replicatum]|nr:Sac2 family-domain-containing protein [Cladochytrium replicatum]
MSESITAFLCGLGIDETGVSTAPELHHEDEDYEAAFDEVDDRISEFQEDAVVRELFSKGVDLREYARDVERDLKEAEERHVLEYVQECGSFVELHRQIEGSDRILANMDNLLSTFQADLAKISAEIETLQDQSQSMNIRLKNRIAVESQLNTVLEGIVISPDLIKKICEGEINEFFVQHLQELNRKMTYVKSQQGVHIRAYKDVAPELERLRFKAAEKSREFLLKKIDSLKAPNTNISIIQQNIFLKYKELFWFLMERFSEAAVEVRQNYINTVGTLYYGGFEKYTGMLKKLQTVIADKLDLMGLEEGAKRGLFTGKLSLKDKTNVYTLGERLNVLTDPDPGIILAHIADGQNLRFPFEAIFKSIHRLLMDNASSEYIFTIEYFAAKSRTMKSPIAELFHPERVFMEIFDTTVRLLQSITKTYADASFDAVGILLCIRLNSQNIMIQERRRVPILESYMNATNMILWPRFQAIMDMHIDSLKKASPAKLFATKDVHPHYITRRYAEFAASVLTLNHGYDDALLTNSLHRCRTEVEALLFRLSEELGDRKNRLVFLVNNYDLVVTILSEYAVPSIDPEKSYISSVLESKTSEFVDEELKPYFGEMVSFIHQFENDPKLEQLHAERFERVAVEFNNNWSNALNSINSSVIQCFSNFQNGARILQAVLTQLLLYYKRYLTMWEKRFHYNKQRVQPVAMQNVMLEIKKYRSAFN